MARSAVAGRRAWRSDGVQDQHPVVGGRARRRRPDAIRRRAHVHEVPPILTQPERRVGLHAHDTTTRYWWLAWEHPHRLGVALFEIDADVRALQLGVDLVFAQRARLANAQIGVFDQQEAIEHVEILVIRGS